jgi:hypothetical protein
MVIDVLKSYEYFVPKKAAAIRKFTTLMPIQQRQRGATFNHFGFVSVMAGGHFVEVYLDDVKFSSR